MWNYMGQEILSKICKGPLHPPGGTLVPLSDFTFNKTGERAGKPLSRCKYCRSSGDRKTIPNYVFMPIIEELFKDRNVRQVSAIVQLDRNLVRDLQKGKRKRINKNTFLNLKRGLASIPKTRTSIGPRKSKTERNGLSKLTYEERIGLKKLISVEQKRRYKIEKKLLKHIV